MRCPIKHASIKPGGDSDSLYQDLTQGHFVLPSTRRRNDYRNETEIT